MNSFDVFDTLVARRYLDSALIFHQIAGERKIENFLPRRIAADNGERSLVEIYRALDLPSAVMDREIELEHSNAIPIAQNLQRVAHGDLLISDMYMSANDILRMVRRVGLDKQVTIYQSNRGKKTGDVWKRLSSHKPILHVGDNVHSDFELPKSLGFNCELYQGSGPTVAEAALKGAGLPFLACLVREVRLGEIPTHPEFFLTACQYNLPWLFVVSELLHRKHSKKLHFLGRDGQLLSYIFDSYYSPCYYLPFSRKVAFCQPKEAIAYLKLHTGPESLLVDIASTGATWEKLNSDINIEVIMYSDMHYYTPTKPKIPPGFSFLTRNSERIFTNELIEVLNCGDHGYLERVDIISDSIIQASFAPLQIDASIVKDIQNPIIIAQRLSPIYRNNIRRELKNISEATLWQLFTGFCQRICAQQHLSSDLVGYFEIEQEYKAYFNQVQNAVGALCGDNRTERQAQCHERLPV